MRRYRNGWPREDLYFLVKGHLFIKMPKVASSSIRWWLRENLGEEGSISRNAARHFRGPAFTVVRNPWDRLASCYRDRICRDSGFKHSYNTKKARQLGFRFRMSFDAFVHLVAAIPDEEAESHFMSQTYIMSGVGTANIIVLQHEDLSKTWRGFCLMRGWPVKPLGNRRALNHKTPHTELYTAELYEMVATRYHEDIAMWGKDWKYEPKGV
jgi:hypothetical protein